MDSVLIPIVVFLVVYVAITLELGNQAVAALVLLHKDQFWDHLPTEEG